MVVGRRWYRCTHNNYIIHVKITHSRQCFGRLALLKVSLCLWHPIFCLCPFLIHYFLNYNLLWKRVTNNDKSDCNLWLQTRFNNLSTHLSITAVSSAMDISGMDTLDFGWKHMTLHVPLAPLVWNSGSLARGGMGASSSRAGKSFVNTNVDV